MLNASVLHRCLTGTATCCCLWSLPCSSLSSSVLITAAWQLRMSPQNLTHPYQTRTATAVLTGEPWYPHTVTEMLRCVLSELPLIKSNPCILLIFREFPGYEDVNPKRRASYPFSQSSQQIATTEGRTAMQCHAR